MAGNDTQAGLVRSHGWHLFRDNDQRAVLTALFVRARSTPGAFADSIAPGGSIGIR